MTNSLSQVLLSRQDLLDLVGDVIAGELEASTLALCYPVI